MSDLAEEVFRNCADPCRVQDARSGCLCAEVAAELERQDRLIARYERALLRLVEMGPAHKGDKRWLIAREAYQWRPPVDAEDVDVSHDASS